MTSTLWPCATDAGSQLTNHSSKSWSQQLQPFIWEDQCNQTGMKPSAASGR